MPRTGTQGNRERIRHNPAWSQPRAGLAAAPPGRLHPIEGLAQGVPGSGDARRGSAGDRGARPAGPGAVLRRVRFGRASTYVLRHGGRSYDSKAILGVAYRFATRQRLGPGDFERGKRGPVVAVLRGRRIRRCNRRQPPAPGGSPRLMPD
jgi:hypothetical protein